MLKRFLKDEGGNFAMLFAGAAMCLTLAVGAAVDYTTMTAAKQKLQSAVDSAALAGAIAADKSKKKDRRALVHETFTSNDFQSAALIDRSLSSVRFDDLNSMVTVKANAEIKSMFLKYLTQGASTVHASASVSYAVEDVNPIALAFALDVSGSMDWVVTGAPIKKIEVLKLASEELFRSVERGIRRKSTVEKVLKASLSSYNTDLVPAWTTQMMPERSTANGTSTPSGQTARGVIWDMSATGGTNSTPAVTDAFNKLAAEKQGKANTQMFMLFMTDGDNNDPAEDGNTRAVCDQAKADGVKIFTVAFEAPAKGQNLLLQCASLNDGVTGDTSVCDGTVPSLDCYKLKSNYYYDARDAKGLKKAFKAIGDNIGEQNIIIRS